MKGKNADDPGTSDAGGTKTKFFNAPPEVNIGPSKKKGDGNGDGAKDEQSIDSIKFENS